MQPAVIVDSSVRGRYDVFEFIDNDRDGPKINHNTLYQTDFYHMSFQVYLCTATLLRVFQCFREDG